MLYDIVYQQQHKNRDPKYYLSDTSEISFFLEIKFFGYAQHLPGKKIA